MYARKQPILTYISQHVVPGKGGLAEGIDEKNREEHEESDDEEGDFQPLLYLAAEDNLVEVALLETG